MRRKCVSFPAQQSKSQQYPIIAKSLIHAKTIESYGAALRKIASDVHDVTDKKRATWRASINCAETKTNVPSSLT